MSQVKTRLLIISDTHGKGPHETDSSTDDELGGGGGAPGANHQYQRRQDFGSRHGTPTGFRHPLPAADVLIHCGDLTYRSTPDEFEATLTMLRAAPAPLKLFIPGNHDVALDPNFRRRRLFPIHPSSSSSSSNSSSGGGYGVEAGGEDDDDDEERAETRALVTDMIHHAEVDGVTMLREGTHAFRLGNGALLTVYASPQTPAFGDWAFQYDEGCGHEFDIPPYSSVAGGGGKVGGVDVAITHGPPHGVLDYSAMGDVHAGCPLLMRAVAAARPQVHCFGHIHEGWGAYRARWADDDGGSSRIDEERSRSVATLDDYRPRRGDAEHEVQEKSRLVREASKRRGVGVDLAGGDHALVRGEETLFVNAAIMSIMYKPVQMPWIVDINLPKAG